MEEAAAERIRIEAEVAAAAAAAAGGAGAGGAGEAPSAQPAEDIIMTGSAQDIHEMKQMPNKNGYNHDDPENPLLKQLLAKQYDEDEPKNKKKQKCCQLCAIFWNLKSYIKDKNITLDQEL